MLLPALQVYVEVRGEAGSSGRVALKADGPGCLERGAEDVLQVTCRGLGEVQQLLVGHDCSGDRRRWHLRMAQVGAGGAAGQARRPADHVLIPCWTVVTGACSVIPVTWLITAACSFMCTERTGAPEQHCFCEPLSSSWLVTGDVSIMCRPAAGD